MKYFFDTEFIEYSLQLISIGMVNEEGETFYRISSDFDESQVNQWVKNNVLIHLLPNEERVNNKIIRDDLVQWIGIYSHPEFWAYFGAHDFVLLSNLLGGFQNWPPFWPQYYNDLRAALNYRKLFSVSQSDEDPHHSLKNALWIKETWEKFIHV